MSALNATRNSILFSILIYMLREDVLTILSDLIGVTRYILISHQIDPSERENTMDYYAT